MDQQHGAFEIVEEKPNYTEIWKNYEKKLRMAAQETLKNVSSWEAGQQDMEDVCTCVVPPVPITELRDSKLLLGGVSDVSMLLFYGSPFL